MMNFIHIVNAGGFPNPLRVDSLEALLTAVLNIIIYMSFPIIVLMIVYTGFLFISAQGNPQKIEAARKALIWTVIGGLIVLGAKALAVGIEATVRALR